MTNSPTLCQKYVAAAIEPVRKTWAQMYIIHYMDNILIARKIGEQVLQCFAQLKQELTTTRLQIAPEKIQLQNPYTYLSFQINGPKIINQKAVIRRDHLKTLNDFQKLLRDINWLRPYLKLTTGELKPLFDILKGDSNPKSPRSITKEALMALQQIKHAIATQFITNIDYSQPLIFLIFNTTITPTDLFWQNNPIMWVHLPSSPKKVLLPYYNAIANLIILRRENNRKYFRIKPSTIVQPYTQSHIHWLLQNTKAWPIAYASYTGAIDNHYPPNKLIQFCKLHAFVFPHITSKKPLNDALLIFTDESSTRLTIYTYNNVVVKFQTTYTSAQLVKLQAIITTLSAFPCQPLNMYTNSAYLAHSIPLLETVPQIKHISDTANLFLQCQQLIQKRTTPFFLGHIRAHSGLPGPLTQNNATADTTTKTIAIVTTNNLQQARKAHALHHLNAQTLRLMFKLTRKQARQIVKQCANYITHLPVPHLEVNPRGLIPNKI
uniref:Reverse transcriptase domain-containing protein n=1 Tax=Macaca mulatta TaxID=9544 RepID=A0A5F8A7E5_MACMU